MNNLRKVIIDKNVLKSVNFVVVLLEQSVIPTHFIISKVTFSLLQSNMEEEKINPATKKILEQMFNILLDVSEEEGGIKKLHNGGISLDSIISNKGSLISIMESKQDNSKYESVNLYNSIDDSFDKFIFAKDATLILHASEKDIKTIRLKSFQIEKGFKNENELTRDELLNANIGGTIPGLIENEFIILDGGKILQCKNKSLVSINLNNVSVPNIVPSNLEQKLMLHLLADKDIPVVLLTGLHGVGKTFLTLVEFYRGYKAGDYKRFYISRANVSTEENGFRPGTEKDKVKGVSTSIKTVLEQLLTIFSGEDLFRKMIADFEAAENAEPNKILMIKPLNNLQGETFPPKTLAFFDEAQNATEGQVKQFLSRVGNEVKAVLAGDLEQVVNPDLSKYNNGLLSVERKTRSQKLVGVLYSNKAETRGLVSQMVANTL